MRLGVGIFHYAAALVESFLADTGWKCAALVRLPERYLLLIYRRLSDTILNFVCIVITVIIFINNILIIVLLLVDTPSLPTTPVIVGSRSCLSVVSTTIVSLTRRRSRINFLIWWLPQLLQGRKRSFL